MGVANAFYRPLGRTFIDERGANTAGSAPFDANDVPRWPGIRLFVFIIFWTLGEKQGGVGISCP